MTQLVTSVPDPAQRYRECIGCKEWFTLEQGFKAGPYFLCHECEEKIDAGTKQEARIITVNRVEKGCSAFKIWTCEIAIGKASSMRLLTDLSHEYMHFILQKNYGVRVSGMWDNVSPKGELDGLGLPLKQNYGTI